MAGIKLLKIHFSIEQVKKCPQFMYLHVFIYFCINFL